MQCEYYSIPEVNVPCVLWTCQEGWLLHLSISSRSYLQEAAVGVEKLRLATAASLFLLYIFGLAKHLAHCSSQISACNISWLDFFKSQPKYRIFCDHHPLTSNVLKTENVAQTVCVHPATTCTTCFGLLVCTGLWTSVGRDKDSPVWHWLPGGFYLPHTDVHWPLLFWEFCVAMFSRRTALSRSLSKYGCTTNLCWALGLVFSLLIRVIPTDRFSCSFCFLNTFFAREEVLIW